MLLLSFMSIPRGIRKYYMALSLFDKTDERKGFVKFMKEETEKIWNFKKALATVCSI